MDNFRTELLTKLERRQREYHILLTVHAWHTCELGIVPYFVFVIHGQLLLKFVDEANASYDQNQLIGPV
jgi:hypothetical protein